MLRFLTTALRVACVISVLISTLQATRAEKPDKKEPRPSQFEYPNAPSSRCVAKDAIHFNSLMYTEDDFDKVVKYYQELVGVDLSAEQGGQVRMQYDRKEHKWSMFVDDSADGELTPRPLRMRILSQDNEDHHLTIIVSRAKTEKFTHVWVVYHEKPD